MSTSRRAHRISISQAFKRQYLKVLLFGGLTALVFVPLVFFTSKETYTATVQLRIDPQTASVVPGMQSDSLGNYYSAYVQTQKFKILKKGSVERALQGLTAEETQAILHAPSATDADLERLIGRVEVEPARDTLILTISLSGDQPLGLAPFLNNLIKAYLEDLRGEAQDQASSQLTVSNQLKVDLQNKISALESRILQISDSISTGNFSFEDIPYKAELKIQEETAVKAENDRVLKEKQYNEFVKNLYKGAGSNDALVEQRLSSDTILLEQKRQQLARIETLNNQLAGMSAQNTGRKDLEDQIAKAQGQLADLEAKAREKYRKQIDSEQSGLLEKQRLDLYNQFVVAKEYEEAVKKSYREVQEKYTTTSKAALQGQNLSKDLAALKDQLSRIDQAQTILENGKQGAGFVTVESWAKPPVLPDKSTLSKTLAIALIGSFAWILVVVVLMEVLDQRVKSAEELKLFTGIRPSWPISNNKTPLVRVTIEERESTVHKAIRSLATRINQERQGSQVKVVSFSGIRDDSGTTEVLINCAHAMTEHCEQILVIDFNVGRPGIAPKLGIPLKSQPTVKQLETSPLESLVYRDQEREIDVLTVRNLEKLENKLVDRIFSLARERYDLVLVDAAPLLKSSNTEHMFFLSDAAVFIVLGNACSFPEIHNTLELAGKFDIRAAALVLNWWKPDRKLQKESQELEPTE